MFTPRECCSGIALISAICLPAQTPELSAEHVSSKDSSPSFLSVSVGGYRVLLRRITCHIQWCKPSLMASADSTPASTSELSSTRVGRANTIPIDLHGQLTASSTSSGSLAKTAAVGKALAGTFTRPSPRHFLLTGAGYHVLVDYGQWLRSTHGEVPLCRRYARNAWLWPPSKLVLIYTTLLLCGATVFTASNWKWAEVLFITRRDYPGGPSHAFYDLFADPANVIGNIVLFVNTALVESLLLWRLYIIWEAKFWIMIVPAIWFVATIGLAVLTCVRSSVPGVDPRVAVSFAVPYFVSSALLNITLTILIASRLLYLRRQLNGGSASSTYFSVASLLIESSVLQSVLGLTLGICFVFDIASTAFLAPLLGEVVCIGPMMILMRVAWGSGFQHTRSMRWATNQFAATTLRSGGVSIGVAVDIRSDAGHGSGMEASDTSYPPPGHQRKPSDSRKSHVIEEIQLPIRRAGAHEKSYLPSI
ncbi:hypothetical protein BKA62DRAFT_667527 [Auriculariales sp. MPI-PUGE-AT-0066]|nr:hypothetical protein BKA62DRAFT_667527 [Auriculariales sp. MPI-PUGE-AT-0066]